MSLKKDSCKPGGCSTIGCEGGHYCYNSDGTERKLQPMTEEEKERLRQAMSRNAAMSPDSERKALSPEDRDKVLEAAARLLQHLRSYSHDPAVSKALKAKKDAEDRFNRNIKRSYLFEKVMKFGIMLAIVAAILGTIGVLTWGFWEATHYDCVAESTAVLRGCEGYTAYKSQH